LSGDVYPLRKKVKKPLPQAFQVVANLLSTGHIQEYVPPWDTRREALGLDKKPPLAYTMEDARLDIEKIAKSLGLDRKLMFDFKTKKFRW